ncbi:hypothetical protein LCGC14_3140540, partial [marine sediment metagenome]
MEIINKLVSMLEKRLPKGYYKPFKSYKTIYSVIRRLAKDANTTYKDRIEWYELYMKIHKEGTKNGYINTKYYPPTKLKIAKHYKECLTAT